MDLNVPTSSEVLVERIENTPAVRDRPVILGTLPGSMFLDEVRAVWERRGSLRDLASVTGPWGVIVARGSERWVVTDPMGLQPVHWARTDAGDIVIASWLAALVDRPDVSDALDYEGILLRQGAGLKGLAVAQRTDFADVRTVPAGHALRIDPRGGVRLERYFDPSDLPGPDESLSLVDCAELIRSGVEYAVRRLTPVDVPVGSHVSGGLDCTSVACCAQQILRSRGTELVAGYSWTPDTREVPRFDGDERSLLDDVASREALTIRPVSSDERGDWFTVRDRFRYPASTHARERYVLPAAARDGVQVMLSGWGGDELASFNGRAVVKHLVRHGKLGALWSDSWQRAAVEIPGHSPLRRATRAAQATAISVAGQLPDVVSPWRWSRRVRQNREERERLRELAAYSPLASQSAREWEASLAGARNHHEYQLVLLQSGHLQHRVHAWYQTGRLFGVAYRYPLLDMAVVSAALRLPWWAYRSHGWSRIAYRLAIEPWVPPNVAWNPRKLEPALFWPPAQYPARRDRPEPQEPVIRDPELDRVHAVMEASRPRPGQAVDPRTGVRPRPEAAPRVSVAQAAPVKDGAS